MLKNLSIKSRLIFVIALLSLIMLAIGIGGLVSIAKVNASLKTVYEDRVIALGQLDHIVRVIDTNQFLVAKAVSGDPAQAGAEMDKVTAGIADLDKTSSAYMATYLTPEEKALSEKYRDIRKNYLQTTLKPAMDALRAQDTKTATDIVQGSMTRELPALNDAANALIQLQLDTAKAEYEKSQR
ncbi:MAG: MCP four helix bundle domain-containing protein, partial [Burkholderiaceae bacterium]|nr:MCP four helix bundle domain-containing protein [Burkholderiaceae bacterium]